MSEVSGEKNGTRPSRRTFLGGAVGATGVALGLAVWKPETVAAAQSVRAGGPDAIGPTGLIDVRLQGASVQIQFVESEVNQPAGSPLSAEGGHATSDVVNEKLGPDHIVHKHLAGVKYEDISINVGTGMSKGFYEWVKSTFDHRFARKDGSIIAADFDHNVTGMGQFFHALISEVGFPALDAASKDAAKMTVKFTPETTRFQKGSGKVAGAFNPTTQKRWLVSNFKLDIAGLDCTRVNKIEALVVKQKVVENPIGEQRDFQQEPAHLEVPNLVVELPLSHAQTWVDWYQDFVIKGNNSDADEKSGSLSFLDSSLKDELFRLDFSHIGIFKLEDAPDDAPDNIRRVKAEMYVESMAFSFKGGAPT